MNETHEPALEPEFEALQLWLDAQTWIEPLPDFGPREVETCAGLLANSESDDAEILTALLALAHDPLPRAGEILRAYAASPHPGFGHLARIALEECEFVSSRALAARVA